MESSWTKVRQMVANRVLTRHLEDLHERQVAMENAQEEHKRFVEQELRMSRNRAGSLLASTDTLVPVTSRRHSLPVSPRLPANHAPPPTRLGQRPDPRNGDSKSGNARPVTGLRHDSTNGILDDPDLLELMADTLQSADSTEQQRPSLYLQNSTGKAGKSSSGTQTSARKDRPLAASTKSQRVKGGTVEGSPRLERGETFVQTDQSQVLTFGEGSLLSKSSKDDAPKKGAKTKRKRKKKGGAGISQEQYTYKAASGASTYEHAGQGSVNVGFYDEETGLTKDDGGFTPKELSLPLNMLEEDDEETYDNGDIVEEEEEERALTDEGETGDPWSEVKKCQYIRGYDPPHMRMPKDAVKFVFGESGHT